MNILKKWILVAAMSLSAAAFANTFTSDLSDIWWNENESGWGVTVTHQREVLFLTFFVYGADGRASWYTGQATNVGQDSRGALIFKGDMYQFTGPAFGPTFNAAAVTSRSAGTLTFTTFLDAATLSFTLDGVVINKTLTRQTFRNNDASGEYVGAIKQIQSQCRAPYSNGDFNRNTEFTINNTATTFAMTARLPDGNVCSYAGNYTQTGRLGRSQGTYTCGGGLSGTYDIFELEANMQAFSGRYLARDNFCDVVVGRFGAMKK